jgi:hypothetical protein
MQRRIGTRCTGQRDVVAERVRERVAAKQHPAAHHRRERVRMRDRRVARERPLEPRAFHDEEEAVPRAPQHE